MLLTNYDYIFLGALSLAIIFGIYLGYQKLIKILLVCYFSVLMAFATGAGIDVFLYTKTPEAQQAYLQKTSGSDVKTGSSIPAKSVAINSGKTEQMHGAANLTGTVSGGNILSGSGVGTVKSNSSNIDGILSNAKKYIMFGVFIVFFFLALFKYRIGIPDVSNKILRFLVSFLIAPFVVFLFLASILILYYGFNVINPSNLYSLALDFFPNISIYYFVLFSPIFLIAPGVLAVLLGIIPKLTD